MRAYQFDRFGLENLRLVETEAPQPGPAEVLVEVKALSLNFRDLLVIGGQYNPRFRLPATPISDGAGVVAQTGPGVTRVRVGDRVVSHFVSGWIDGPFRAEYVGTTLGLPRTGLAAELVVLPAEAVVSIPAGYSFAEAATLPIAALTAWSVLVTVARVSAGQTVLTLGTGGVSVFALQLAKALGARVIITSSSDQKLERARQLGADGTVNYRTSPNWDRAVLELTEGRGVDVVVETGGAATLGRSLRAAAAGATIGMLGALTGLKGEVELAPVLMKRLHVAGILVDSRAAFEAMNRFIEQHGIRPVIGHTCRFEQLREALRLMQAGGHFGKIVVEL